MDWLIISGILLSIVIAIILVIWGPISIWLIHETARSLNTSRVIKLSILFLGINIAAGFFMFWTLGGGFGPGVIVSLGYVLVVLISTLMWIVFSVNAKKLAVPINKRRLYVLLSGLVVASQLLPSMLGYSGARSVCMNQTKWIAKPIILAIEEYKKENGEYPTELDLLIPDYLKKIPKPACYLINEAYPFDIRLGQYDYNLLTQLPGGGYYYCYSFNEQGWYTHSFFDGTCEDRPPETTP